MKIVVNGTWRELPHGAAAQSVHAAPTLESLLLELGYGARTVATALNGDFVPVGARARTMVREGDWVEVVAPMQGG